MTQYRVKTPAFVPGFLNAMDILLKDDFQTNFKTSQPAVNILEHGKSFEIVMNVPGLSKDDFKISLEKELLTVSYEHQESTEEVKPKFVTKEFTLKSFSRSFTINESLKEDEIVASYENGILSISLPKAETKAETTKTIKIN